MRFFLSIFLGLVLLQACGNSKNNTAESKALAKVGKQYLYLSDVPNLGKGQSPEDSLFYLKVYVNKWIQDRILETKAKEVLTDTEEIDRMVENYRSSVLINEYEQMIISQRADSVISPQEISQYYEENKEQYQAGLDLIRCHFLKAPRSLEGIEEVREWFRSENDPAAFESIKAFCVKNKTKTTQILDENTWIRLDKVVAQLPANVVSQRDLRVGATLDRADDDFVYLFRIYELRSRDDAAPLQQVQASIRNILLYQRQQEALKALRKELYEAAKNDNRFEIYID